MSSMETQLIFEQLEDLILTRTATKKQIKLYNKLLKRDYRVLEPRVSWF